MEITNIRPLLKRTLAVFMAVLMVMSTLGAGLAFAGDVGDGTGDLQLLTSGDCGMYEDCGDIEDNVKWELYDNGTLYIYGEGLMKGNYSPWSVYEEENDFAITEIIIDEGITDTRGYVFSGMENVNKVSLPSTLERIGCDAFCGTGIEEIHIPAAVSSISSTAFNYCYSLREITVDEDNDNYYSDEYGCLFETYTEEWDEGESYTYKELFKVPAMLEAEEYTVTEDISYVYSNAFVDSQNLRKVIIEGRDTGINNFGYDNSITEIEGYICSPAHFAAINSGKEFTSIDGVTVEDVEFTQLPYRTEYETGDGYIDMTGAQFTVYLSDESEFLVSGGDYVEYYEYDFSEEGEKTVKVGFFGKEFTFNVTVIPEKYLTVGKDYEFTAFSGGLNRFYFVPAKSGEYIFTVNQDVAWGDMYIYNIVREYDEEWDEWYDYWYDVFDVWFNEGDDKTYTVELEAGEKYIIQLYLYNDEIEIPAAIRVDYNCVHKNVKNHAQQNPTCTNSGFTAGTYCEDCETWISGHSLITALGHNANDVKITKAATCAVDGVKTYSCTVCGAKQKEEKIPATGAHVSDGGKETKAATYDAEGVRTYTCTVCKKVIKTEAIAKLIKPTESKPVEVKVKKPAKVKIKSAKSTAKKKAVITWKKVNNANGYQVAYSTSKKFAKKATKTKLIKKVKTTKLTIKKLKSGKKYFIKVRAFKNVKGKKLYGSYSKVKTVKVK